MTTKLKERPGVKESDPVIAPKWKCVAFDKNGKSYRSIPSFKNEDGAIEAGKELETLKEEAKTFPHYLGIILAVDSMDGPLKVMEYSYYIPMPLGE